MGIQNDRTVYQQEDGTWANKRDASEGASSVHYSRAEALSIATSMIKKSGGGQLTVKGVGGELRSVHEVASAKRLSSRSADQG